jgi:hypothetical protein
MFMVERFRRLLYCFNIRVLVNEVLNLLRVDMISPIMDKDSL